ncbi:Alpha/Beta hydrolase protein [Globomyces pollinis-pini]|nr:Alpha/Beta hydrolase protein [Globomyces pollinis-pini]
MTIKESFPKDVPVYERFEPTQQKTKLKAVLKTLKNAVPALASSTTSFVTKGPTNPEWNFPYHVAVNTVKGVMEKLEQEEIPDVYGSQLRTSTPTKIPKDGLIAKDSFPRYQTVIDFFKLNDPGEWPKPVESLDEVYGEWLTTNETQQDLIIYMIHGGAFVAGSAEMHRSSAYRIGKATQSKVFSINYRLAPQNPYPCGLVDVISGYLYLLKTVDASKIVFYGDSAGGNLVITSLLALRDMKISLPAGGYCLSPWVDLTHSFPSFIDNAITDYLPHSVKDPRLGQDRIHYYTENQYLKNQFVSPFWAKDLKNLCPLLIQCGNAEKLYDEVVAFATKMAHQNTNHVTLEVYNAHVHVFQVLQFSKGSKMAIVRATDWIQKIIKNELNDTENFQRIDLSFDGDIQTTTSLC